MASFRIFKSNVVARAFITSAVKSITAAVTATRALNAGLTNLLDAVAGFAVTLPSATASNVGNTYRFMVGTALTSGSYIIKVGNTTDAMFGAVLVNDAGDSSSGAADVFATVAGSDTFTLAFSAGAGIHVGDWVQFESIAAGKWAVTGVVNMLDPTTPFSSTVN
jgi:hypothetical protein